MGACDAESGGILETFPVGYLGIECAKCTGFEIASSSTLVSSWVQP